VRQEGDGRELYSAPRVVLKWELERRLTFFSVRRAEPLGSLGLAALATRFAGFTTARNFGECSILKQQSICRLMV
jgi:hypothetical protein